MVKLCCIKDIEGMNQEYYLDEKERKVYKICMDDYYEESKFKLTTGLICLIGPCVTITGILFDDKIARFNFISKILSILFLIIGIAMISKANDVSERKKYLYITNYAKGEVLSKEEIWKLNVKGKKERIRQSILLLFCFFLVFLSMVMYFSERNISSVIVLYTSIFGTAIFIKILAPMSRYKKIKNLM